MCPDACIYNDEVVRMSNKHSMEVKHLAYTLIYIHIHTHTFNTFTPVQYSVNSHVKHANAPER